MISSNRFVIVPFVTNVTKCPSSNNVLTVGKTLSPNKVSPPAHIFIKHVPKRFLEKDFFISSGVFSISII